MLVTLSFSSFSSPNEMPTEYQGEVRLSSWGREAHITFGHKGVLIGILIFCKKKRQMMGEMLLALRLIGRKLYPYILVTSILTFIRQKNTDDKTDIAFGYSMLDAKYRDTKRLKSGYIWEVATLRWLSSISPWNENTSKAYGHSRRIYTGGSCRQKGKQCWQKIRVTLGKLFNLLEALFLG